MEKACVLRTRKKREKPIIVDGIVKESVKNFFKIEISPDGRRVDCSSNIFVTGYICGKIRQNRIRIVPGDRVCVSVSKYDFSRGRIIGRQK